jgi:hypothetical protein
MRLIARTTSYDAIVRYMVCEARKESFRGNHRIWRSAVLLTVLTFLSVIRAAAQSRSSDNIFVGYSFTGANLFTGQHASLNGWNISAEKKFLPFFGVVADFSGHYGSKEVPFNNSCGSNLAGECLLNSSVSQHYFQFGVRGSYAASKIRPYAELLFGAVRTKESASGMQNTNTSFAETLAAGLDARITRLLGWRIEAGWVESGTFTSRHDSIRASTGLVFRF